MTRCARYVKQDATSAFPYGVHARHVPVVRRRCCFRAQRGGAARKSVGATRQAHAGTFRTLSMRVSNVIGVAP